jgi:hypothetical protein
MERLWTQDVLSFSEYSSRLDEETVGQGITLSSRPIAETHPLGMAIGQRRPLAPAVLVHLPRPGVRGHQAGRSLRVYDGEPALDTCCLC